MSNFPIITKFGGRDKVVARLALIGLQVTRDQVRMWEARGRIPGDAQVALMALAEKERIRFSAHDFRASNEPLPAAVRGPRAGRARAGARS